MRAVDERLGEIETTDVAEVLSQRAQQLLEDAELNPSLVAPMDRLRRRVAPRQVLPLRASSEDPEDAIHDVARGTPRTSAVGVGSSLVRGNNGLDDPPLVVGEVHAPDGSIRAAERRIHPTTYGMRSREDPAGVSRSCRRRWSTSCRS